MSSTVKYKAKQGDTVAKIAEAIGVTPGEITALNEDIPKDGKLAPNKTYQLPASAAQNSATAINDLIVEYHARKAEAEGQGS